MNEWKNERNEKWSSLFLTHSVYTPTTDSQDTSTWFTKLKLLCNTIPSSLQSTRSSDSRKLCLLVLAQRSRPTSSLVLSRLMITVSSPECYTYLPRVPDTERPWIGFNSWRLYSATEIHLTHQIQELISGLGSRTLRPVNILSLSDFSDNIKNGISCSDWPYNLTGIIERIVGKLSKSNLLRKIKQETTCIYVRTKANYRNETVANILSIISHNQSINQSEED